MSVSNRVGLAHSDITEIRLALLFHTLLPYELLCQSMASLTLQVLLLVVSGRRLNISGISSAVDLSHPRQQGNMRQDMNTAGGIVHSVKVSDFCASAGADNVIESSLADDAVDGRDDGATSLVMVAVMDLTHLMMLCSSPAQFPSHLVGIVKVVTEVVKEVPVFVEVESIFT